MNANMVKLHWDIAESYHLYKNKFQFSLEPASARITNIDMPTGEVLDDETFGKQEAYKKAVDITLNLKTQDEPMNVSLTVKYQGCSEKGLCYPPQTKTVQLALVKQ